MTSVKKWKILEKKDVSPSKWFPVEKHTIKLPNGNVIDDYYISPIGNVAMVLPFTKNIEVLMVRQYKHALGEILLELPAGFRQKGRTIKETAVAELEEEIGARIEQKKLISLGKISNNPTKTTHVTYGFLARDVVINSKQQFENTEDIEIVKIKSSKLISKIQSGEIWVGDSVVFIMKAYLKFPKLFK